MSAEIYSIRKAIEELNKNTKDSNTKYLVSMRINGTFTEFHVSNYIAKTQIERSDEKVWKQINRELADYSVLK